MKNQENLTLNDAERVEGVPIEETQVREDYMGLPQEKIRRNVEEIRYMAPRSSLVKRVLEGETSFEGEIHDLFYFYEGFPQFLKGLVRTPKLREDHDKRLEELERTLIKSGIDLMSTEKEERYESFRKEHEEGIHSRGLEFYMGMASIRGYEALRGEMSTAELSSKELNKRLRSIGRRIFNIAYTVVPAGLPSSFFPYMFSLDLSTPQILMGSYVGLTLGAVSVLFPLMTSHVNSPPTYGALEMMGRIMDEFIEKSDLKISNNTSEMKGGNEGKCGQQII